VSSLARVLSRGQAGLVAYVVTIEVHISGGLPTFAITGLPAAAVRESKDRVRAALQTSGFEVPAGRITVHLGPADVPKQGGRFDLAIALGVLLAHQKKEWATSGLEFLGELALNGELRPITGALPAVIAAQKVGHALVLPPRTLRRPRSSRAPTCTLRGICRKSCGTWTGSSRSRVWSAATERWRPSRLLSRTFPTCAAKRSRSARSRSRRRAATTC
jgi:magnesium chelatase family protein